MIFDTEGQCYVARKKEDFRGWTVLSVIRSKPGVCVVWCFRTLIDGEEAYRSVYVSEAEAPQVDPR